MATGASSNMVELTAQTLRVHSREMGDKTSQGWHPKSYRYWDPVQFNTQFTDFFFGTFMRGKKNNMERYPYLGWGPILYISQAPSTMD